MYNDYKVSDDLKSMMNNERIVWSGRPKKSCFVLECIFNPMLIFAFIWFMFDFMFISQIFSSDLSELDSSVWMFVGFFALHLMPVWIYLGGVIFSFRKLKNTEYAITDRGIYVTSGCFAKQYNFKPFTDLSHVYIHRGIFDQWLGVGDVISECHHYAAVRSNSRHSDNFTISDIPDYVEVCNIIKKYQTDIYADTQFPNDYRPQSNHGYNTNYYPNSGNSQVNPTMFYDRQKSNNYYNNQNNGQNFGNGNYNANYNPNNPNNQNYNNYYNQNNNQNHNGNYNANPQNFNSDYSSNPGFTGENCDTHDGYEVNAGSNNYDSWDNPKAKKEKDSWDKQ